MNNIPITPDTFGVALNTEDYNFMSLVLEGVTEQGQLPFTIPVQSLPRIIWTCSKFFYRHDDESVEERWYVVRKSDLLSDNCLNKVIKLPEIIESVYEVHLINEAISGIMYSSAFSRFYSEPLYRVISNYSNKPFGQNIKPADTDMAIEESVAKLFEISYMQSMFGRHVRFHYNNTSHNLNIMGHLDNDLVLSTFQRVALKDMYTDERFYKHVVGTCLMSLKRILSQFNFSYPGEIEINFDELQTNGKDIVDAIETEIKESSYGGDLILMT